MINGRPITRPRLVPLRVAVDPDWRRAYQYPMSDCMNPAYAYYSLFNARTAWTWHERNGCQVGVCATMTAAIIMQRRYWK